ncbi:uncharacterized protein LOC121416517 [Lytechinus variegatus]|uniref:uncharacterized protein LOC121416517 n=1 Tax=Lytechinus variegatus TaxID=7654 RepID=UPI001BB2C8B8|nr:uncharacterized protein LOC121416517 [Lytechinus variegatus]
MPRNRRPTVRCYIYDSTEGHSERIKKEEAMFGFKQPLTQECEMLLIPTGDDLRITIKDKNRQQFKKTINYESILHLERNVIFVELDYSQKPENELNITLNMAQGIKPSANSASLQFRTVLQAAKRLVIDEDDDRDSKSRKKKHVENIEDDLLFKVADQIDNDEVLETLMGALDISLLGRRRCLEVNRSEGRVTERGTRDVLLHWREKTRAAEQRAGLESALKRAELHDLSNKIFKD